MVGLRKKHPYCPTLSLIFSTVLSVKIMLYFLNIYSIGILRKENNVSIFVIQKQCKTQIKEKIIPSYFWPLNNKNKGLKFHIPLYINFFESCFFKKCKTLISYFSKNTSKIFFSTNNMHVKGFFFQFQF